MGGAVEDRHLIPDRPGHDARSGFQDRRDRQLDHVGIPLAPAQRQSIHRPPCLSKNTRQSFAGTVRRQPRRRQSPTNGGLHSRKDGRNVHAAARRSPPPVVSFFRSTWPLISLLRTSWPEKLSSCSFQSYSVVKRILLAPWMVQAQVRISASLNCEVRSRLVHPVGRRRCSIIEPCLSSV